MANLSISFISIFFFFLNFPFLTSPNIKTNHLLVSLGNLLFLHFCSFFYKLFNNAKKNFIAPFNGWGSTASRLEPLRGGSLPFTTKSQKFLVLTLSISEGWKAESTLEPPSGFEHGTSGLGIQHLYLYAIAPYALDTFKYVL